MLPLQALYGDLDPYDPELKARFDGQIFSVRELARLIADQFDLAYGDAWNAIINLSSDWFGYLLTPEGWSIIAAHVLGLPRVVLNVTVH